MAGFPTKFVLGTGGFVILVAAWQVLAMLSHPFLLPSPVLTAQTAASLLSDGVLLHAMAVSLARILAGWLLGAAFGIPLGLLMGLVPTVRDLATPYIQGLRYIPPIAFVGLFIVWFGAGEASKVGLVFYTTFFIIVINTMAGTLAAPAGIVRAAQSLGATSPQVLVSVLLPCTVPYIVTGLRMALGNAFIVIAAAEMLAASSGMGFLVWSSRSLMLTDQIFVGFIVLGLMGLVTDRVVWALCARLLPHYRVV